MANGSFYNYVKGTKESEYFGLYCEYTYAQNIAGNYTDVTVDVYIRYYSINIGAQSGTITVCGESKSFTSQAIKNYPTGGGGKTKLTSQTFKVSHNSNGTKTGVSISVKWNSYITYSGTYYATLTASKTVDLPTIPRASTLQLSTTSLNVGGTITATITKASDSFKHTVEFYINSTYYQKYTDVDTSKAFKIPTSWYSAMPSSPSCTAYCRITTFNGGTQIGDQVKKNFTVKVPDGIGPSIDSTKTIYLNPGNITTSDSVSRNILVKDKNKISFYATDKDGNLICSPGAGSSIKSYKYEVLSEDGTVIASKTTTSTYYTFGPFSKTGTFKFRLTATDNRERSISNEDSEPTWTCYDYELPYFSAFNAYRANSDGTPNVDGTYLKCTYTQKYSPVNNTNSATVTVHYNNSTSTNTLINLGNNTTTYKVYLEISDNYGGSNKTSTITVFGKSRILNITSDGTGVAIGKMADSSNLFECRWPAKFDDAVTVPDAGGPVLNGYSVGTLGPGTEIPSGSDLNSYTTPGVFYSSQSEVSQSLTNCPTIVGGFRMVVEYIGSSTYIKQTIITRTASCVTYMRYKNESTWADWVLYITDKNIGAQALPLSGGTITGALTTNGLLSASGGISLPSSYAVVNDKYGLDCNNSDIIDANGIYFSDLANAKGEGIHFARSDADWDTLYANDGVLKFHPGRATDTAPGGYKIYNSSNFRRNTCTLSSSQATTVSFSSALGGTPTVMLTPLTEGSGVITAKVQSANSTGFTAIIGGSSGVSAQFAYLAMYY